ncbi:OmpA family protein [Bacteroidales bacterium OttesenSCG-928-A17]|nr:OmpA family protein [Bacteroidales bacterium OttesenSCG-928-A17]
MKSKIVLTCLLLSVSCVFFAQENSYQSKESGYKTAFKHSGAGENWFLHIGAGAQTYLGDHDSDADFKDRITWMPTLSLGKWFSPYWGVRIKGQGGPLNGFEENGSYKQEMKYYNLHLDAMWNLSNYWGTYSPNKVFNFTPYIGLGFAHRFQMDDNVVRPDANGVAGETNADYQRYSNALSVNGGIQLGFRLSKRVNLDFDLGVAVVPDYFDRVIQKASNEAILSASGGLTFRLGKVDFDAFEPMDYVLINDLNNKINALRTENDLLSERPENCPECPQVAAPVIINEINFVPNVVFFRINSSKVDENQQISIFNTAEFMKESGEKIKVVGYADKDTGTDSYNFKLSEKRARAVAKELTTKHDVPTERIVVEWKGSDEQPYPQNNWNRVVIMSGIK